MATTSNPPATLDRRFSDPAAAPTAWSDAARLLEQAELFWLTTEPLERRDRRRRRGRRGARHRPPRA
jgi:hypothetical protein